MVMGEGYSIVCPQGVTSLSWKEVPLQDGRIRQQRRPYERKWEGTDGGESGRGWVVVRSLGQ